MQILSALRAYRDWKETATPTLIGIWCWSSSFCPIFVTRNFCCCRWFYDSSEGVCHEFSYAGRKGNGNRFLTRQDCEASCQPSQVRDS